MRTSRRTPPFNGYPPSLPRAPCRVYAAVTALALSLESLLLVPIGGEVDSLEGMMHRKHTVLEKAAVFIGIFLLVALCLAIR